ncbi:MAG: hypothetical protein ACLQMV_12230, partial [Rhodoblastus sp.]|uniref:hypothetical protein n=1 Tax=Rhodoblastus sp. TaxID=1962975 RepID=UPI003FD8C63B
QSITDTSSGNPDPYYYLGWALYGADSKQIASPYYFSDFTATLSADGTYTLAVDGTGYTTSSISYSFEAYQNVTTTAALTLGTEVTGALANPGDQAQYTFTGSVATTTASACSAPTATANPPSPNCWAAGLRRSPGL